MHSPSRQTPRFIARSVAAMVAYTFLFNQFAHAAKLPRSLAMLQEVAANTAPANLATLKTRTPEDAPAASDPQQQLPLGPNSPEVPVRERLQSAHKLFVMDAGTDANYPLSATAGVDRFIATLQAWGRYTLVDKASDADLVLQFRNVTYTQVEDGTHQNPSATVYYEPEFRLTIADPQTLKPLWSFVLPVYTGTAKRTGDDLFAVSVGNVTSQLKVLAGETLTPAENAALYPPPPKAHRLGLVFGIVGLAALVSLPAILFVKSKDHAEEQQHQFCVENHLPC